MSVAHGVRERGKGTVEHLVGHKALTAPFRALSSAPTQTPSATALLSSSMDASILILL